MEELLNSAFTLLATHGYLIVFLWMFADQAALPIPGIPLLVAAGALAATGDLSLSGVIAAASIATLLADTLWYMLGRFGGTRAISTVCRLSIEPDSCVSTTRSAFGRFGPVTLVIAKFLPGVQTLAPASVGFVRVPWLGFFALDVLGTLLFVCPFVWAGYYFQAQLASLMATLSSYSGGLTVLVLAVLGIYLAVKIMQWTLFYRGHRLRRLTPEELHERLQRGDDLTVIDLRQQLDYEVQPHCIPGVLRIPINEISRRRDEIPTRYDVVLVCT
jgi:membrane protein DedA with SNARE-associated domain